MSLRIAYRNAVGEFTSNVYKVLLSEYSDKNIVFSPYILHTSLGVLALAAGDETRKELIEGIGFHGIEDNAFITTSYQLVMKSFAHGGYHTTFTLYNASRIYYCKRFELSEKYMTEVKGKLYANFEPLDFSTEDTQKSSVKMVNQWVSRATSGKVINLVKNSSIDSNTSLLVINAIYFRGKWARGFKKRDTCKKEFCINANEKVKVDMMRITEKFPYAIFNDLDCTAIVLPYKGARLSMVVYLPNSVDGLSKLQNSLGGQYLVRKRFNPQPVSIELPKFRVEATLRNVGNVLQKLGMETMFSQEHCNFNNFGTIEQMSDTEQNLKPFVSQIFQKICLVLDEEGGAAVENCGYDGEPVEFGPEPEPSYFFVHHPFYYQIVDHANGDLVLFAGHCTDPSKVKMEMESSCVQEAI